LAVRGDIRVALSIKKVFVIAKKFFASLFGQTFAPAEVINSKIPDQDTTRSFVIFLSTKRPPQIEVRKSNCPLPMRTLRFDERKAAEPVVDVEPILDLEFFPVPLWDFDGACLLLKLTGLCSEFAVQLWQHPKEPI
jgi:hypothetical protein